MEENTHLIDSDSPITKIENIPENTTTLECYNGKISKIENLPENLMYLDCADNQITIIENLPKNVEYLNCSNNQITKIKNLPGLLQLNISKNPVDKIENLPDNLKSFHCCNTNIKKIENLPIGLITLIYSDLEIKYIDNIELCWFKVEHQANILPIYNIIKRLQRRRKLRFKRNKAAWIIQNNCYNWLWKAVCMDGKPGINITLGWNKIQKYIH